jgi:rubredoxin
MGSNKASDKVKKQISRRLVSGKMLRFRCTNCGAVYDPEKGNSKSGVPPNTPFEELPDAWVCPDCGSGKEFFEELAE